MNSEPDAPKFEAADQTGSPTTSHDADEYRSLVELYKYYTQLSFEIVKYYLTLNVALVAALVVGNTASIKGVTALLVTAFALVLTGAAMASFRKCIKHCAIFRERAVKIEKKLGYATFIEIRKLNLKTRGTPQAARTIAMALSAVISCLWLVFLLHSWGVQTMSFNLR